MLSKKELIESLKKFSKFTVVSLASLVLVGGSLSSTASARRVKHIRHSRIVKKNHAIKFNSYKHKEIFHHSKCSNKIYHHMYDLVSAYINLQSNSSNNIRKFNDYFEKYGKKLTSKQLINLCLLVNPDDRTYQSLEGLLNTHNQSIYNNTSLMTAPKRRFESTKDVKQLSLQDNQFDTDVRVELIKDINNTRVSYGLRPLIITNAMQKTANYRNPRVMYAYEHLFNYINYSHNTSNPTDNWVHGADTHDSGYDYLNNNHYSFHNWSANAGNDFRGNNYVNGDGAPLKYNNDTAKGFADNINDGLMNHDDCQGNHNGHRYNELNKNWKYLGVGVTYDSATHMGSFNEQFAC